MNEPVNEIPEGRQVWLRAFYGFEPDESGYLGFTREADRETMLERMQDGDLVLVYGAIGNLTETHLRQQALGFLEIIAERCTDEERAAQSHIEWKNANGFKGRWTFGIKVRRAWRVRNRVHIKTVAPEAYDTQYRFERTTRAHLLTPKERARALSHTVYQVNVYGEPEIPETEFTSGTIENILKPSRGIPPSLGTRTSNFEDGDNFLYLMTLKGGAEVLLGESGPHKGKALIKIGRSNNASRRLDELNKGFPERAIHRWALAHRQKFIDAATAHRFEDELKALFEERFTSEGGEFFTADQRAAEEAFIMFCTAKMPIIKGAPAKAGGVK